MAILPTLQGPSDLRGLTDDAARLGWPPRSASTSSRRSRRRVVTSARRSGVVELTIALHRVLESPRDKIVWDTGHQAYAHKLLTGRYARFGTLRQLGGIGGFPRRERVRARRVRRRAMPAPGCRSPRAWPRPATCATRWSGSRWWSAMRR